jgi:hypothetical protein
MMPPDTGTTYSGKPPSDDRRAAESAEYRSLKTSLARRPKKLTTSLFLRDQDDRLLLLPRFYHQLGEYSMAQGILPFQYEVDEKPGGMTALAGLPVYFEFAMSWTCRGP